MSLFVDMLIVWPLIAPVLFRGNHRDAILFNDLDHELIRIKRFVCNDVFGDKSGKQFRSRYAVMNLSTGEQQSKRLPRASTTA